MTTSPPPPPPESPRRWRTWQLAVAATLALLLGVGIGSSPADDGTAVVAAATAGDTRITALERDVAELEADLAARNEQLAAAEQALADAEDELERTTVAAAEIPDAARTWTVVNVVDGDTIDVVGPDGTEERIRVVGIDTPERGACGFGPATSAMTDLVLDQEVELVVAGQDDRDRYGRLLRYVDVDGIDAGRALIEGGFAIARYDSRDGYGRHLREADYVAAEATASPSVCAASDPGPEPSPDPDPAQVGRPFENCTAAREAGAAPVMRGDPGYGPHLDRDGDGIGCE